MPAGAATHSRDCLVTTTEIGGAGVCSEYLTGVSLRQEQRCPSARQAVRRSLGILFACKEAITLGAHCSPFTSSRAWHAWGHQGSTARQPVFSTSTNAGPGAWRPGAWLRALWRCACAPPRCRGGRQPRIQAPQLAHLVQPRGQAAAQRGAHRSAALLGQRVQARAVAHPVRVRVWPRDCVAGRAAGRAQQRGAQRSRGARGLAGTVQRDHRRPLARPGGRGAVGQPARAQRGGVTASGAAGQPAGAQHGGLTAGDGAAP